MIVYDYVIRPAPGGHPKIHMAGAVPVFGGCLSCMLLPEKGV